MLKTPSFLKSLAVVSALVGTAASSFPDQSLAQTLALTVSYKQEINQWRVLYEQGLRSPKGWLTVAGLFWLKQGDNWAGSLPGNAILLPKKSPATLGSFRVDGDEQNPVVRLFPVTNVPVSITRADGSTPNLLLDSSQILTFDNDNGSKPDIVSIGDLSMFVVRRTDRAGTRFALRVRDSNSTARQTFKGCTWFPVKPAYRIEARFITYDSPKTVEIQNILGGLEKHTALGYAEFRLGKETFRLEAEQEGNKLFFNFRDQTSGKATYPAGRFLYADLPHNGVVTLDFNKAENPPCAFTSFATCPLPPRTNWLKVGIEAGEKTHHPHDETVK
jgi:uncharacterized protein (DUF1684 family)